MFSYFLLDCSCITDRNVLNIRKSLSIALDLLKALMALRTRDFNLKAVLLLAISTFIIIYSNSESSFDYSNLTGGVVSIFIFVT